MPRLARPASFVSALVSAGLLLAACASPSDSSDQASTTAVPDSTTSLAISTTVPPTTEPQSTEPVTTSVTTTEPVVEIEAPEPIEILDMRPGMFLESAVMGDRLVLFGADAKGGGGVFWATDQPFESAINIYDLVDPDIDPGSIHQMVYLDGRYYGFPIWAEAEDKLSPTMYVSSDGSTWEKTNFGSITKQASLRLTPDQPSAAGGAGVATAIVVNGQIEATGWITENDLRVPVLWVGDGTNWVQTYLPTVEGATQGGYLASSKLGRLASLEGPTYFGFGTFVQMSGGQWQTVPHTLDADGSEAFTRYLGASDTAFYHLEFMHTGDRILTTSVDGIAWTELPLPEQLPDLPGIHVSPNNKLVSWNRSLLSEEEGSAMVWSKSEDGWTPTTYHGSTVLLVTDDHIVTSSDSQIYIYERS